MKYWYFHFIVTMRGDGIIFSAGNKQAYYREYPYDIYIFTIGSITTRRNTRAKYERLCDGQRLLIYLSF